VSPEKESTVSSSDQRPASLQGLPTDPREGLSPARQQAYDQTLRLAGLDGSDCKDVLGALAALGTARLARQMLTAAEREDGGVAAEVTALQAAPQWLRVSVLPLPGEASSVQAVGVAGFPDTDRLFAQQDALAAEHGPGVFDVAVNPRLLALLSRLRPAEGAVPARLTRCAAPERPGEPATAVQAAVGERIRVLVMPVRRGRGGAA
jgi:hypothetical protein